MRASSFLRPTILSSRPLRASSVRFLQYLSRNSCFLGAFSLLAPDFALSEVTALSLAGFSPCISPKSFMKSMEGAPPSSPTAGVSSSESSSPDERLLMALFISSSMSISCSAESPSFSAFGPSTPFIGSPNSLAQCRQYPSVFFSPPSTFVTNITAILFLHFEHFII